MLARYYPICSPLIVSIYPNQYCFSWQSLTGWVEVVWLCCICFWKVFWWYCHPRIIFFKKALRYNFHTIKFTAFKCTIQNFYWVYRLVQPSPEYTFRTFPSLQKYLSVHLQSQNLFPRLIHSQQGETGFSLRQRADFFLFSVHERYSSGPDFINKVFIRNLSSENPKDSFSIPNTCLKLSHQVSRW